MADLLMIISVALSAWIIYQIQDKIERNKRRKQRAIAKMSKDISTESDISQLAQDGYRRTIDLIGMEAYKEMTQRIDMLLEKHKGKQCISLPLTCGPDSKAGADTLHTLLPGIPLSMTVCYESGVGLIDVYAEGRRIGRLALSEATTLFGLMKNNKLEGAYVAEQNCYGIEGSHELAIIIFYDRKETNARKSGIESPIINKGIKGAFNMN